MNTKPHTRTPEQRKAEAEALHQSIIDQVQQLADSGQWRRFLDFAHSFHTYSLNNLLLILAQNPDATMVAGFRQWQTKGRQVRRGEKAIKIFGYSQTKTPTAAADENAETDETDETDAGGRTRVYFPILSVFDITQTDPIDGAEPLPENPARPLTGADDGGIIAPLSAYLGAGGWAISHERLARANGYTDPEAHAVTLAIGLSPAQEAKTLIHEVAHIELGHIDDLDEYRQHRGRMEVEAESVAYVVAGLSGLDTSEYSVGYIAGWSNGNIETLHATAVEVLSAVDSIIRPIDRSASNGNDSASSPR